MEISNQRILLLTPSCWLRHLLCRWIRERRRGTILSLVLVEISDVLYKMLNYFFFFLNRKSEETVAEWESGYEHENVLHIYDLLQNSVCMRFISLWCSSSSAWQTGLWWFTSSACVIVSADSNLTLCHTKSTTLFKWRKEINGNL